MNKYQVTLDSIKPFYKKNIDIYLSPPIHYRMRCEFSYKKNKYVMYDKNNKLRRRNRSKKTSRYN